MKKFIPVFLFFLFSCGETATVHAPRTDSAPARPAHVPALHDDSEEEGEFLENVSCEDLNDPNTLLAFAGEVQQNGFPVADTTDYFITRGNFTQHDSEEILVWLHAYNGGACGTGCNLVMIFTCSTPVRMICSETVGIVSEKDIRDLDGDGIPEIIAESGTVWQG